MQLIKGKISAIDGLRTFPRAVQILSSNPHLLRYVFYSIISTIVAFLVTAIIFFMSYQWTMNQFLGWLDWGAWGTVLEWLCHFSFFIGYLVLAFLTFSLVAEFVSFPFMDILSAKVEELTWENLEEAPFWVGLWRSLPAALLMLFVKVGVMIIALPLLIVPLLGVVAYFLINAYFASFDFLDLSMGRRGWSMKQKISFLQGSSSARMIFGMVVYGCFLTPFLNVLVIPIASIAGTLLFIEISSNNNIK